MPPPRSTWRNAIAPDLQDRLHTARQHAQTARFPELLTLCQQLVAAHGQQVELLLEVGVLLQNAGLLTFARACFAQAHSVAPTDLRATVNLANLAREAGDHAASRRWYAELLQRLPDHPVIRRNALVSLEYDPDATDAQRLEQARAWGAWATARAGGPHPRPACRPSHDRPLRLGYVTADACQHTVGLFLHPILAAHDPARVTPVVYSAGTVKDWVTAALQTATQFRDVSALDDTALAALIRADAIDVLVDLSGHTAGSRLTVFVRRPAPVQIAWLGYFATTGLDCLDAVVLDDWHAPSGTEAHFVEPIRRLPGGRFCYQPVPWAPATVAPAPRLARGHVAFGSFNNTAKLNPDVIDVWARILAAVPDARLVLKWRTLNDAGMRQALADAFAQRGIAAHRLDLRGPSFHAELLTQYADLDIALDPFPFTGGLTSCEALWMGVPVVTWPQSRVASRQTFAFLSAIGLPELAARDGDDYVRIAVALAQDRARLVTLRGDLRRRLRASPLLDVAGFTRQLEQVLSDLYRDIAARATPDGRPSSAGRHA